MKNRLKSLRKHLNAKGIFFLLFGLSVIVNFYHLFSSPYLFVSEELNWSVNELDGSGFLEPINYQTPDGWNTLFYIHASDLLFGDSARFFAREIVITGSSVVNLPLREYEVIKNEDGHIVAEGDTYVFEVKKDGVYITDNDGQRAKLATKIIRL